MNLYVLDKKTKKKNHDNSKETVYAVSSKRPMIRILGHYSDIAKGENDHGHSEVLQ